jgi:CheY-like chemotaxis protein
MTESPLEGKRILAVDDEPDVLDVLQEEIAEACPSCAFDTATTYEDAAAKLKSGAYDAVILDIMGVRGFDLLDLAVAKNMKAVMLTAHALNPEALKRSYDKKAQAYLPKDKLGEIVPYLERLFEFEFPPGWKYVMRGLEGYFNEKFTPFKGMREFADWLEVQRKTGSD